MKITTAEPIGSVDAKLGMYVSLRLNAGKDKANRDEVPVFMRWRPLNRGSGAKDLKLEKVVIGSGPRTVLTMRVILSSNSNATRARAGRSPDANSVSCVSYQYLAGSRAMNDT